MTELIKTIERKGQDGINAKREFKIRYMKLKDLENNCQLIDLTLSVPDSQYTTEIYYYIKKIDHVQSVEVEQL